KEDLETELSTIVDLGGTVLDVFVEHEIYGQIRADLFLESKKDVHDFLEKLKKDNTQPLYTLTDGAHYHTIEGRSEEILDLIEEALFKRNYLIKE
ncbi:MAG TPA: hypothetical protein IAC41_04285, partial [Candidatus Merdenecus merdavium]|nr:hypothetical protein [Candidatus Merdenecus merdavium]